MAALFGTVQKKMVAVSRLAPVWKSRLAFLPRLAAALGILAALALPVSGPALAGAQGKFPDVIPLPNGWQPEGIVIGRGTNFYVGSLATGAIFRGNLATGTGDVLVPPQDGRIAVGLGFDKGTGYIYAAGGPAGAGYVYDSKSGEGVAAFQFTTGASFVNDVVVTPNAAYFTDSAQPSLYKVPLEGKGDLEDAVQPETIPLGGDFTFVPNAFNANGIVATPGGRWLIIVNSSLGALYRVDPASGNADLIDLGGAILPNGDGLLLKGTKLYVVQNQLNQISVVQLDRDLTSGEVVEVITDPNFRVPTTIDNFNKALYVVNARFGTEPTPDTEYEVVRVSRGP